MSVSSRITVVAILLATTVTMSASRVTMLVTTRLSVTLRNAIIRATTRKTTVTAAAKVATCAHNVKSVQHAMSVLSVTNARPVNCVQHVTLSSLARSEERRVGKECRSRRATDHGRKDKEE